MKLKLIATALLACGTSVLAACQSAPTSGQSTLTYNNNPTNYEQIGNANFVPPPTGVNRPTDRPYYSLTGDTTTTPHWALGPGSVPYNGHY